MRDSFPVFGSPVIGEAEIAEVVDSVRSGWIGTGPKVHRLGQMLAEYVGHSRRVSYCTAALILSRRRRPARDRGRRARARRPRERTPDRGVRELWPRYHALLADLPVTTPTPANPETTHARHLYQVTVDPAAQHTRDELLDGLTARRIGTGVHYRGVHLHPFYRDKYGPAPEQLRSPPRSPSAP